MRKQITRSSDEHIDQSETEVQNQRNHHQLEVPRSLLVRGRFSVAVALNDLFPADRAGAVALHRVRRPVLCARLAPRHHRLDSGALTDTELDRRGTHVEVFANPTLEIAQVRAVEFAGKYKVPLRVLSSFEEGAGTLISLEGESKMEDPTIAGIAFQRDEAKLTVAGIPDIPGLAYQVIGPVSAAGIEVDVIVQNAAADGNNDITFTVKRSDSERAKKILDGLAASLKAESVSLDKKIGKVSVVGVGMKSHAGIASKMFKALADENINIQIITTSEIKISIVIEEKYLELAVRALHSAFDLGDPDYEKESIT